MREASLAALARWPQSDLADGCANAKVQPALFRLQRESDCNMSDACSNVFAGLSSPAFLSQAC